MAHSWRMAARPLAILWAAGLASLAPDAGALALGDAEVRSTLGEALDLRIPVTVSRGESIEVACFSLARTGATPDIPRLGEARISLERSAQGARLRIRSATPVNEPALVIGVVASCPGQTGESQREYSILLDPRPATAAPPRATIPAEAARPAVEAPRSIAATLIARIGDTLASIANAIFPRNRSAKRTYIEALRDTNPPLATLADDDPIPVDTPIALPDLRTFARGRSVSPTQLASAPRAEPGAARESAAARPTPPQRETAPRRAERAPPVTAAAPRERPPLVAEQTREERRAAAASATPRPPPRERAPGFQLKLSSVEVDLARSRAIDDRLRAQLRDRQLVLDVDDQVSAVLALRNSVRQLESRVAELQLKLAGMPASFPAPQAQPSAPKTTEAPKAAAPPKPVELPKVEPPKPTVPPPQAATEPPKPAAVEPAKPAPVEAPKVAVAPPAPAAVEPKPSPPVVATPPAVKPPAPPKAAAPAAAPTTAESLWRRYGLWALLALLVAATAMLVWGLARRRREAAAEAEDDLAEVPMVVAEEPERREPVLAPQRGAAEAPQRAMTSDASLPTRLPDKGADDLRRRYIEERFPEIVNRTIVLDDPESVIKGARLFYEDGAIARAVELLQFAIERRPEEIKTWLALFEVFRLERLSGEFAQLATRFKQHHGKSDYWRKVQFFGREIDPGNELYRDESFKSFETIGTAAAAARATQEPSFDPIAENWLKAPMDFENEVLANELRKALMVQAGINERDLAPNPMPALRNVEMFTVA